jgi:LysM repeat protein
MTVLRGLDASAWTNEIAPSVWEALISSGIKVFTPQIWGGGPGGTGPNPYLKQQVEGALAAGLKVFSGYVWPSWHWPDAVGYWEEELSIPLKVIWLDVEAGAGVHPDQVEDIIGRGFIPGIYASRTSWGSIQGTDSRFSAQPLWVAHYRSGDWPTDVQEGEVPWMPDSWERPVGWQWMGTTTLHDEQFDLIVWDEEWVTSLNVTPPPEPEPEPEPEEEEGMSSEEFQQLQTEIREAKGLANAAQGMAKDVKDDLRAHIEKHPAPPPPPPPPPNLPRTYTVRSGDTLSGIAAKYPGVTWQDIYAANRALIGGDPNLIQPGMVLTIP